MSTELLSDNYNNSIPKLEEILRNVGVGYRPIDDPFFQESYRVCKVFQRLGVTVEDEEELCHDVMKEFFCYVAGCKATFNTLVEFEMHYNSKHRYVCTECKKTLPSPRILDIHIQETHDSFFQVLSLKKPMYQCFDSECDQKFNNAIERREHCLSVHKYPKHFRFDSARYWRKNESSNKMECEQTEVTNTKQKRKKVNLNKNQRSKMFSAVSMSTGVSKPSSTPPENPLPVNKAASALAFVPRQVQRSYTKVLTKNQSNERNVLETGCMVDIADSLPQ